MTKRVFLFAMVALLCAAGSVFGEISPRIGGGLLVGGLFTRYTLEAQGELVVPIDVRSNQGIEQLSYGAFLFVDATWVELSLSLQGGNNAWRERYSATGRDGVRLMDDSSRGTGQEAALGLALLGKYPIRLDKDLSVFPLAGLEYRIALLEYRDPEIGRRYDRTDGIRESDSNDQAYALSAWNSLFIDIGAGLDLDLRSSLFLRVELLYGFRLQTSFEKDALNKVKIKANAPAPKLGGLTSGPTLRIALGYRFY
jgi:opacity protein-like surface antigen